MDSSLTDSSGRIDDLERRVAHLESLLNSLLRQGSHKQALPTTNEVIPITAEIVKSNIYQYRPLDSSRTETRILVLDDSAEDADPIKCRLLHSSLDYDDHDGDGRGRFSSRFAPIKFPLSEEAGLARLGYEALSYTWGNHDKGGEIILDSHRFSITKNLEGALRHMRRRRRLSGDAPYGLAHSYWWIDAICINQGDIAERNQQVALMRRIYRSANTVRVWLGEEADGSALALDLVYQLNNNIPKRGPGRSTPSYPEVSADQKAQHWEALAALLRRPWWERAWVRQEIALKASVTIHCGDSSCQWHDMMSTVKWLNTFIQRLGFEPLQRKIVDDGEQPPAAAGAFRPPYYFKADLLRGIQNQVRGGRYNYANLQDLVSHARYCQATDPRDKIISVLGLADPEIHQLEPDYRLTIRETYQAVARTLISTTKTLDLLGACQNPEKLNGLPSWVPNLLDDWKAWPFQADPKIHSVSSDEADYRFKGSDILRVKGSYLDSLQNIQNDIINHDDSFEQLDALLSSWKAFAQGALLNPKMEHLEGCYIKEQLLGKENERAWIEMLSIGHDKGHGLCFSETGELLPEKKSEDNDRAPAVRLAKSLLFPDQVEKVNPRIRIYNHLRKHGIGRRLGLSEKGIIGLVPADARPGDSICLLKGGSFPYLLRKQDRHYVVVGETCKLTFHSTDLLLFHSMTA